MQSYMHAASCALQYAASLSSGPSRSHQPKCRQPSNCQRHLTPKLLILSPHPQRHLQSNFHPLLSGSTVQIGWIPSHTAIADNEPADAAAKPAAKTTPSDDFKFPWSYPHICAQIRSQLLPGTNRETTHRFSPPLLGSQPFSSLQTCIHTSLPGNLAASYLLGHPNQHRPDPGLCPRC